MNKKLVWIIVSLVVIILAVRYLKKERALSERKKELKYLLKKQASIPLLKPLQPAEKSIRK